MFVRTKDWIYDTDNLHYRFIENNKVYEVGWDVEKPTFVADIIKQSKNIEELCDGFYIDEGDEVCFSEAYMDTNFNKIKAFYLSTFDFTSTLYGFIKTKNGLVYIAKLNKKGKLELI